MLFPGQQVVDLQQIEARDIPALARRLDLRRPALRAVAGGPDRLSLPAHRQVEAGRPRACVRHPHFSVFFCVLLCDSVAKMLLIL